MRRLLSGLSRSRVRAAAAFLLAALLGASAYGTPADGWERRSDAAFCHAFSSEPGTTDITQDAAGFLWIATQSGLQRRDGYRLRRYTGDIAVSGALPDNASRRIRWPCRRTVARKGSASAPTGPARAP
jgi:hypothetical protein